MKEDQVEGKAYFTISEVVRLTGVSKDKIRYYEEKGLLKPMQSSDNRYRYYSEKDMDKILAIELYRSVDLGIPEMQKILYQSNIGEISDILEDKQKFIEDEIMRLEIVKRNLWKLQKSCMDIKEGLGLITIRSMPPFRILGELEDYRSYSEYPKLHAMNDKKLPIFRKMKRHIVFSEEGLVSNKMLLTEELPEVSGPETIKYDTCIHILLEDGAGAGNIIIETFERVKQWCQEKGWGQLGEAYLDMLLITEQDGNIRSYLELYGPVELIKEI